ncbi:MAG: hypothetical protein AAFR31_03315 [Cyanobacteria bacterium J06627_8]
MAWWSNSTLSAARLEQDKNGRHGDSSSQPARPLLNSSTKALTISDRSVFDASSSDKNLSCSDEWTCDRSHQSALSVMRDPTLIDADKEIEFDAAGYWHDEQSDEYSNCRDERSDTPNSHAQSAQSDELPIAFIPPAHQWQKSVKPIALVGGVAIASAAGLGYLETLQPNFEGSIRLAAQPVESASDDEVELVSLTDASTAIAAPESLSQPSFSISEHTRYLEAAIVPQALAELQAQGMMLNQSNVLKNLEIEQHRSGVVEISYQAKHAEEVNDVLRAIADTYEASSDQCQTQSCLSADYIQTQIRYTERTLEQQKAVLHAFQEQHQLTDGSQHHHDFENKARQFSRTQHDLEQELLVAQTQLSEHYAALGLDPSAQQAEEMLAQSANYQRLISEWKAIDRQIVGELITPLDDASRTALTREYEELSQQLYRDIHRFVQNVTLHDLTTSDLWYAILENPQRADRIEDWLNQAQLLELLSIRHKNLTEIGQQLNSETQQWRSLLDQERRLEANLRQTAQTLANYRNRYAAIQNNVSPEHVDWHVVEPLEVLEMKGPLASIKNALTEHWIRPAHAL